jgi:glycosyltransferase involved in cell wall biosynthesis
MSKPAAHSTTVLVISNVAWDSIWQRHQTIAQLLARDHDVIYCEIPGVRGVGLADAGRILRRLRALRRAAPVTTVPSRLRVLRPFVLPATNALFCAFNDRQMRRLVAREPALARGVDFIVNYSVARTALQLTARVPHRRLVFDCTDDLPAVTGVPAFFADDEKRLLREADLTLVPSRVLEARKGPMARRCVRLPHGALVERFLLPPKPAPTDGRLTLLYYGHLHRQHLDFAVLDAVARARPSWRIILVGPVVTPHAFPPNVETPGQQPHERLRDFVAEADVLLLPYVLNHYTEAVLPAKTYECLATGRPVVAAPLPELRTELDGFLRFAIDADGWIRAVEQAMAGDSPAKREARVALARANSWEARYAELRTLLQTLGTA